MTASSSKNQPTHILEMECTILLRCPRQLPPTQVVAQIVGKLPVLEVRQVYIPNYYANSSDCYTAVLVDGGYRQEVVLLHYFGVTNNGDIHAGWWSKVYDLSSK